MASVRGCDFPDGLYYDVAHHTWYAPAEEGLVRVGMTQVGVALAREILVVTPRRAGTAIEAGRSFATIESAKWVGAVRAAFDATVVAANEMLRRDATLANADCYSAWLTLLRPAAADWRVNLVTGEAVAGAYEAWMESAAFPGCDPPG